MGELVVQALDSEVGADRQLGDVDLRGRSTAGVVAHDEDGALTRDVVEAADVRTNEAETNNQVAGSSSRMKSGSRLSRSPGRNWGMTAEVSPRANEPRPC